MSQIKVPTLEEMSPDERVDAAIGEIWYLVQGGQDGREYTNSILFIIRVLESFKCRQDPQ